jgi:hypothetical protein
MPTQHVDIQIVPGIHPTPDTTDTTALHYVNADKVRFQDGRPEKLGGWQRGVFQGDLQVMNGCPRSMFSMRLDTKRFLMIGTHTNLYALSGPINNITLYNLTPLVVTPTVLGDLHVQTLDVATINDPIATTISSNTITLTYANHLWKPDDLIEIAGSTAINGIPALEINKQHIVRCVTANTIDLIVSTNATSTGSGGGAAVTISSGVVTIIDDTEHGFANGDRVKITGAADTGGILAAELNLEFNIRNVTTDTYDFVTEGFNTGAEIGGGASTARQEQIGSGGCDVLDGQGYGLGLYGAGLYGVSKLSANISTPPRVYSFDRFGNLLVLTPGDGEGLYEWDGDTDVAPVLVVNAPTSINYVFVSNNIIVTLGADGVLNRLKWSDQGNRTDWTPTSVNFAGEDDIEGANEFISHVRVRNVDLLFTDNQLFAMRFVGKPTVWSIEEVHGVEGVIGRNARISYKGIAYWMGQNDFYFYNGGVVGSIPGNSQFNKNTVQKFVFDNINRNQQSKAFMWVNKAFDELWIHYPSSESEECNRYVIYSIKENHWTIGTIDRTASETPKTEFSFPRMANIDGFVYKHEMGFDDDLLPMEVSLETNFAKLGNGTQQQNIEGIIPDAVQTGDIDLVVEGKDWPQSTTVKTLPSQTITPTTEKLDFQLTNRFRKYTITSNTLGSNFRLGNIQEILNVDSRT